MDNSFYGILDELDFFDRKIKKYKIEHLGDENKDRLIYLLYAGSAISGYGALMRRTISGLYCAELLGAIPVVSWGNASLLNNKKSDDNTEPFEYFYNSINEVSIESALKSWRVVQHNIANDSLLWADSRLSSSDGQTGIYIAESQRLIEKYNIRLKDNIINLLEEDMHLLGLNHTLGIHIRGAQRKRLIKGLGNPVSIEQYFEKIDELLQLYDFDNIFVATDDEFYLQDFIKRYGSEVIYYSADRFEGSIIPYFSAGNDAYKITYEIIRDIYTLCNCASFIGGPSNVTSIARCFQPSYGKKAWEQSVVLDNGICIDGEANFENTQKIIENGGNINVLNGAN